MTPDRIIDDILRREGSRFTNDPADAGGPTKYGITQRTLSRWLKRRATVHDVKDLSEHTARLIYRGLYIEQPGFLRLRIPSVQAFMVDFGVNVGPHQAIKILQRTIGGLVVDGILGAKTARAAERDPKLLARLIVARSDFYMRITISSVRKFSRAHGVPDLMKTTNLRFLKGWLRRTLEFIS